MTLGSSLSFVPIGAPRLKGSFTTREAYIGWQKDIVVGVLMSSDSEVGFIKDGIDPLVQQELIQNFERMDVQAKVLEPERFEKCVARLALQETQKKEYNGVWTENSADSRTKKLLYVVGIVLGLMFLGKACGDMSEQPTAVVQSPEPQVEQVEPTEPEKVDYSNIDDLHSAYITRVNQNLVRFNVSASSIPDSQKFSAGWRVCESLDSGQTLEEFYRSRFDPSQMTESEKGGAIIVGGSVADAAVKTYCPQHTAQLNE
jgi:hypothetical protein